MLEPISLRCDEALDFLDEEEEENDAPVFQYSGFEFDSVLDWLETRRQFLIASFSKAFPSWVIKNLNSDDTKTLTTFSEAFIDIMAIDANHPYADADDIACGANIDMTSYFIDIVNNRNNTDLISFLNINPKLVIFFHEELPSLEPIATKWAALKAEKEARLSSLAESMKSFLAQHREESAFAEGPEKLPSSLSKRKRTSDRVDPTLPVSPAKIR